MVQTSDFQSSQGNENFVYCSANGAVTLYYDNAAKLATTSTGIDVTGTVTSDGLTVDGDATISDTTPSLLLMESDTTNANTRFLNNGGDFFLSTINDAKSSVTNRFSLDHATGDISFYEDTGTTAKLFWDASAERLGLGTSSPAANVEISGTGEPSLKITDTGDNKAFSMMVSPAWATDSLVFLDASAGTAGMVINDTGNVGIGTLSPSFISDVTGATADVAKFKRSSAGTTEVLIDTAGSGDAQLVFANNGTDSYAIGRDNTNGDFVIAASGALGTNHLINIESGGNVGIGLTQSSYEVA